MATTTAGADLTEEHRRQQLVLRVLLIRQLVALWPGFDPDDIAGSWPRVIAAITVAVRGRGRQSAALAERYYLDYRRAERIPGDPPPLEVPDMDPVQIGRALTFSGPHRAGRLVKLKRDPGLVSEQAFVHVAGTASRLVLNQGRDVLTGAVERDSRALGWARVSDGAPCFFCAMLISRGPVYKEGTVQFNVDLTRFVGGNKFAAHDHCGCTAEPAFFRDEEWPSNGRALQQLWRDSTEGRSGARAIEAFRQAYEASLANVPQSDVPEG